MDRLSALPESRLLSILYNLGLKKAAQTSVLSKQWRFLWAKCSFSCFRETSKETEEIRRFVAGVNALIAHGRSPPLDTLRFFFYYDDKFAADVDSWLDFAAKNRVKSLLVQLQPNFFIDRSLKPPYTLPQIIYSIASLTWLHLNKCTMIPTAAVDWRCLERLSLLYVKLSQQAIDKVLSGCPLLETLDFEHCDGIKSLEIGGRSFRDLKVTSDSLSDLEEISAPYMTYLNISVSFGKSRIKARLRNVQSLETARICLGGLWWDDDISVDEAKRYTMDLFQDLRHVEDLHLFYQCTEVLAMMRNEWQLPQCWAKDLSMEAPSSAHYIRSVLAVLESCPYVENLFLTIHREHNRKENSIDWGPLAEDDFNCDLLHLKIVKFENYSGYDLGSGPILTLQQILLKRAPLFEKDSD